MEMKYNRAYLEAVLAVANSTGDHVAEQVFNKLFDVKTVSEPLKVTRSNHELHQQLNKKVGQWVYLSDIQYTNNVVGRAGGADVSAVSWIKHFRSNTQLGLTQSKQVHDFVRDHKEFDAS
jgi:hypothetical protein